MGFWKQLTEAGAEIQGFENGVKGESPRVLFDTDKKRQIYHHAYEAGQKAAVTRAMNKVVNKLTSDDE